jgi:plasmid stabilization system protein ParE
MSRPIIITQEAEEDIAEAKDWYNMRRPGLGEEFLLCVEDALERVQRMPEIAAVVLPNVRRVSVRRFPYGVFFRASHEQITRIRGLSWPS